MTFFNSIKTCYMKSFNIKGRASKSEYWWFWLYGIILAVIQLCLGRDFEVIRYILVGISIASIPASFSVMLRRFHDAGFTTKSCLKRIFMTIGLIFAGVIFTPILVMIFGRECAATVHLVVDVLIPLIGWFIFVFIVLIGDSAYDEEEEE